MRNTPAGSYQHFDARLAQIEQPEVKPEPEESDDEQEPILAQIESEELGELSDCYDLCDEEGGASGCYDACAEVVGGQLTRDDRLAQVSSVSRSSRRDGKTGASNWPDRTSWTNGKPGRVTV